MDLISFQHMFKIDKTSSGHREMINCINGKANVAASVANVAASVAKSVGLSILEPGHMTDVKVIKWNIHFDDYMVIKYQVLMPNFVFSFDLIDN